MNPRFVFFGTPDIAVASLDALEAHGLLPTLIITAPDAPQGRGLRLAPSPVRAWADAHGIAVDTPIKLDAGCLTTIKAADPEVGVVVAYGKILPQALLDLFPKGIINMHPSLLPKHRGPSPIESQIRNEESGGHVGVSVMLLDAQMDHGHVLAQTKDIPEILDDWPMRASALYPILAREGGTLLAETLPKWVRGAVAPLEQDHDAATYCGKIKKEDALLDLDGDPETNYRKFLAYDVWPRAYFVHQRAGKPMRIIVTEAVREDGMLKILRVIPEGKKEMSYDDFRKGFR